MVVLQYFWTYSKYARQFIGGRELVRTFAEHIKAVRGLVLYNLVNRFLFLLLTPATIDNYLTNYQGTSFQ